VRHGRGEADHLGAQRRDADQSLAVQPPLSLTRPTRHRLHLEELSEPKLAALAPVTRRLDASKRRARAAPLAIHLNHSGLELRHDAPDAIG